MPQPFVEAVEVVETHVPGQPVDVETTTLWESKPWQPIADACGQAYLRAFARQVAYDLPESEAVGPDPDLVYPERSWVDRADLAAFGIDDLPF